MNCSSSTIERDAWSFVRRRQIAAHAQLAIPLPPELNEAEDEAAVIYRHEHYLSSNPDYSSEDRSRLAREMAARRPSDPRHDVSALGNQILVKRVDELKGALLALDASWTLDRVCFGLLPGGGLDAFAQRVPGTNEHAVFIPAGLFNLVNLTAKIVVMLQPFTRTPQGIVYMPSASFQQLALVHRPYVRFRQMDLLRAFFLHGDPAASLPYLRAVPYQDRFGYLLSGTELFVFAHEAAHIRLGHLADESGEHSPSRELDADALALRVLVEWFRMQGIDYPIARACLCGLLFLSLNRMWEWSLRRLLGTTQEPIQNSHPPTEERFRAFSEALDTVGPAETPRWYIHHFNAIRLATDELGSEALDDIAARCPDSSYLHAAVLPSQCAHLGHTRTFSPQIWCETVAELLTDCRPVNRKLGLWFLVEFRENMAAMLYEGLLSEDDAFRATCERALISVEPLYRAYLPRLRERFMEERRTGHLQEYVLNIAIPLLAKAQLELTPGGSQPDPMEFDDE